MSRPFASGVPLLVSLKSTLSAGFSVNLSTRRSATLILHLASKKDGGHPYPMCDWTTLPAVQSKPDQRESQYQLELMSG